MIWEDAQLESDFDGTPEEATSQVATQHAIGFLVRKNTKEVILAMDFNPDDRKIRFTFSIPRKMVRSITELRPQNATTS